MFVKIVLSTVDLDDETVFETHKIHNESCAWRLPPKMIAALSP